MGAGGGTAKTSFVNVLTDAVQGSRFRVACHHIGGMYRTCPGPSVHSMTCGVALPPATWLSTHWIGRLWGAGGPWSGGARYHRFRPTVVSAKTALWR